MVWVGSTIVQRKQWAPGLITLQLDTVLSDYAPGQFVNLGLDIDGKRCKRSYSVAAAVGAACELYIAEVAAGELTPRIFECQQGTDVWLDTRPLGFFTLKHIPETETLWLIATGTGLGPYIAFLRNDQIWQQAKTVVLVHGVRDAAQLGYADEMRELAKIRGRQFQYLPFVSRPQQEQAAGPGYSGLAGRITTALRDGRLEQAVGIELQPQGNHVMLCGNPAMIEETRQLLEERGMSKHRVRKPGQITFESYW